MSNHLEPFGCKVVGYCPFNNKTEGFPCPDCPYEKQGGYTEEFYTDLRMEQQEQM